MANQASDDVSVIDGSTNKVVGLIKVGTNPISLSLDTKNNKIYVANQASDDVSVIDGSTNKVSLQIPVKLSPKILSYSPYHESFYLINWENYTVDIIDNSNVTSMVIYNTKGIEIPYYTILGISFFIFLLNTISYRLSLLF